MSQKFSHLHVHSEYSLLDGLSKTPQLIDHVKNLGMDSLAITDHGTMYGAIEFYKEALSQGIKPIIGMEGYVTNIPHGEKIERSKNQNFHIILLAKNQEGYKNLMKLTSIAHIEGFYYKPRFDKATLKKYSKGLIATSACPLGEIGQSLIADNYTQAKESLGWYLDVFGEDFFLELQRHDYANWLNNSEIPEVKESLKRVFENSKKWEKGIVSLSRDLGVPLIATNDAHYIKQEQAQAQDALVCIATGKTVADVKRLRYIDTPDFYVKSPQQMSELFSDLPEALTNTVKISEKCNIKITLDKWFFPLYKIDADTSPEDELTKRAREGLRQKFGKNIQREIVKRLEYELETINKKGYATYFLIVSDMAIWAASRDIITNTRGSAAGSLVSYCIGIININPLQYELPFERFLTPWRPSPPDIDFDIADDRREEVINYLIETYGEDKVAQICTFGRMLSRAAVRDVARVLGFPYSVGDKIAKLIPPPKQGFPITIQKALSSVGELKSLYDGDKDAKRVLDLATQIEGNARHVSVHAAGVVIAPSEISDFTPLQLDPEGKKKITQYDMDALDPNVSPGGAVGLLKFDLLGLRNLAIIGSALKIIETQKGKKVVLQEIPLNDTKTFSMLSRGETMGVFQLSGGGMTKYLKDLKPSKVEDLMAMVALYRPGPISSIPQYIERKNDKNKVSFFDPRMKEFLSKSYGLLVYQDDVLLTAINLAGYTWEEADKFRKAIGKKIPTEMAKQHDRFVEGCVKGGMGQKKAEELFSLIETFAAYGFNKAHAASYGMVAYWTAYLKANFPNEYMTALLTAESGDIDKVSAAVEACRLMKIKVLPPDINESFVDFTLVADKGSLNKKAIRFGLSAIKNVGASAIAAILSARSKKFSSLSDFLSRVEGRKVNKKVLESLIKVGALSGFGNRATLLVKIEEIRSRLKPKSVNESQGALFSEENSGKEDITFGAETYTSIQEFEDTEIRKLERELMGFSLSDKPLSEMLLPILDMATHRIEDLSDFSQTSLIDSEVKIAGVLSEVRVIVTKKSGAEMAFAKVKDPSGTLELIIFPKTFEMVKTSLIEKTPILVSGKPDFKGDAPALLVSRVFALENISNSAQNLYIRVPKEAGIEELKKLKRLLLDNPGAKKVSLFFESNKKTVDLSYKISWNETMARMISEVLDPVNPPS